MNKGELVDAIASETNLSKTDAENALNAFISTVQNTISSGDKVTLPGFGTFAPTLRLMLDHPWNLKSPFRPKSRAAKKT